MQLSLIKRQGCATPFLRHLLDFRVYQTRQRSQCCKIACTVIRHRWMKRVPVFCTHNTTNKMISTQADKVMNSTLQTACRAVCIILQVMAFIVANCTNFVAQSLYPKRYLRVQITSTNLYPLYIASLFYCVTYI